MHGSQYNSTFMWNSVVSLFSCLVCSNRSCFWSIVGKHSTHCDNSFLIFKGSCKLNTDPIDIFILSAVSCTFILRLVKTILAICLMFSPFSDSPMWSIATTAFKYNSNTNNCYFVELHNIYYIIGLLQQYLTLQKAIFYQHLKIFYSRFLRYSNTILLILTLVTLVVYRIRRSEIFDLSSLNYQLPHYTNSPTNNHLTKITFPYTQNANNQFRFPNHWHSFITSLRYFPFPP